MSTENAVTLADGRVAYRADETGCWYIVSAEDWRDLELALAEGEACTVVDCDDEHHDAYSHWCAGVPGREVDPMDDHDLLALISDAGGEAEVSR